VASDWTTLDDLGSVGMESDLMPTSRDPKSLDLAVNVRAQGEELRNAGGYTAILNGDFPP